MGEAQLLVVPLSGGVGLSAEQASLSEAGYDALGMAVPDDFGRPGAGIQVLLSAEDSFALVTIAAVHNGSAASIALADPDRLVSGGHLPPTVQATTDVVAGGHLEEEATRSGSVAVIAPHGGGIERQTDFQAGILAADTRLQVDTWVCRGRACTSSVVCTSRAMTSVSSRFRDFAHSWNAPIGWRCPSMALTWPPHQGATRPWT